MDPEAEQVPDSDIFEYNLNTGVGRYVEGTVQAQVLQNAHVAIGKNNDMEVCLVDLSSSVIIVYTYIFPLHQRYYFCSEGKIPTAAKYTTSQQK